MKSKPHLVAVTLALLLISLVAGQQTRAQHTHGDGSSLQWRTGMLRISSSAWVGDVHLKSGMYHVTHVMDGDKHMLVFKSVALPAGKEFPMWEEKEVARLECSVEPSKKRVRNTKVILAKTYGSIRRIQEIQIAGEKVRHILLANPPTT